MAVLVNVVGKYDDKDIEKARRALDGLGREAKKTGTKSTNSMKAMGVAVAAVGAAITVRFGVDSVKAFAEAEKSQARLGKAFEKFPLLADTNIEALRELNTELQAKTGYDDDQTAAAQAVLAQYKLTGQQIRELTPLMQDYATATGQDVTAAAGSLGKALLGNARALKAVGIDFKATGDRGKDLDTIMAALRTQVGGLAESEGKTAAGQLKILEATVGDLQESVGEALVPALTDLVKVGTPVVRVFGQLPTPVRSGAIAVGVLGTAFVVLTPKVIAARTALLTMGPAGAKAATGMSRAGKAAGVLGAAMLVSTAVNSFSKANVNAGQTADELAKSLKNLASGGPLEDAGLGFKTFTGRAADLDEALGLVRDNHWWDQLEGGLAGMLGTTANFNEAKNAVAGLDDALTQMVSSGDLDGASAAIERMGIATDEVSTLLPQYATALANLKTPGDNAAAVVAGITTNADKQKAAIAALKESWGLFAGLLDKRAAKREWLDSMAEIDEKVKAAGGRFDESTGKGRAFQEWLDTTVGNLQTYASGFKNPLQQQKVMNDGLDKIKENLKKQGLSDAQVTKIMSGFDKIKGSVVDLQTQAAKAVVLNIKPQITGRGQIILGTGGGRQIIDVGYRKRGGDVKAGHPYVVGEERPELFIPNTSGTILPRVPSGGGGVSLTIAAGAVQVVNPSSTVDVDRAFDRAIERVIRELESAS